jgi:hypothetical protein
MYMKSRWSCTASLECVSSGVRVGPRDPADEAMADHGGQSRQGSGWSRREEPPRQWLVTAGRAAKAAKWGESRKWLLEWWRVGNVKDS